jgi:hypothetical protein
VGKELKQRGNVICGHTLIFFGGGGGEIRAVRYGTNFRIGANKTLAEMEMQQRTGFSSGFYRNLIFEWQKAKKSFLLFELVF